MDRKQLIESYVEGWKRGDANRILNGLSPECTIIESHGPRYAGTESIKKWIDDWNRAGSTVDEWKITSFDEAPSGRAFFEWSFKCTVHGEKHALDGISVVEFDMDKISYMREYRATHPIFDL